MATGAGLVNANVDSIPINLPFAGGKGSTTNFKDQSLHDYSIRETSFVNTGGNLSFGGNGIENIIYIAGSAVVAVFAFQFLGKVLSK